MTRSSRFAYGFWRFSLGFIIWVCTMVISGGTTIVVTAVLGVATLLRRRRRNSMRLSLGYSTRRGRAW